MTSWSQVTARWLRYATSASASVSVDIAIETSDIGRKSRIGRSLMKTIIKITAVSTEERRMTRNGNNTGWQNCKCRCKSHKSWLHLAILLLSVLRTRRITDTPAFMRKCWAKSETPFSVTTRSGFTRSTSLHISCTISSSSCRIRLHTQVNIIHWQCPSAEQSRAPYYG